MIKTGLFLLALMKANRPASQRKGRTKMKTASPALIKFLNEVIGFYDGQLVMPRRISAETTLSRKLRLRDLLEHAAFGFDADGKEREGCDQIGERECVQHISAGAVSQHQPDHGRRQK